MKFLDANVFIYAYYKPKKQLTDKDHQERSKRRGSTSGPSDLKVLEAKPKIVQVFHQP